jgi:hypothetical protein
MAVFRNGMFGWDRHRRVGQVNTRPHRETRRRPVEALAEERTRLHPLPTQPFTVAFGTTRRVRQRGRLRDGPVSIGPGERAHAQAPRRGQSAAGGGDRSTFAPSQQLRGGTSLASAIACPA